MKNILLIGLIFLASISYGQQIQIREVGNLADLGGQIKFQVPAEDLARVRGKVLNEKGKPLQNANILICGTTMFFDGSSNKNGFYSVSGRYGNYTVVAFAAGYKKQSVEVELSKGTVKSLDFQLEPIVNVKPAASKGDVVRAGLGSCTIVYDDKNSTYASMSLYDLVVNLPCVELGEEILFNGEGGVTLYINNQEAHVPIQSLMAMFRNIGAQQVSSIRLVPGNSFNKLPPSIFINYK